MSLNSLSHLWGCSFAVESVLKAIGELGEEIEGLHYREHKRIAIQGIISAIRYISCSSAAEDASEVELVQVQHLRMNAVALKQL